MSAELRLALLRQRMTGVKDKSQLAELRKREQEFVSLAHIKARTTESCGAWLLQIVNCGEERIIASRMRLSRVRWGGTLALSTSKVTYSFCQRS